MPIFMTPDVRDRMLEFLGGHTPEEATAAYIVVGDEEHPHHDRLIAPSQLDSFVQTDHEISRSLWDRKYLVIDLDIEYVNFDFPAEAYLHPERVFRLQEEVVTTVKRLLKSYGIRSLHLMSGRGHHFIWQIRQDSSAFFSLARLGNLTPSLREIYLGARPPSGAVAGEKLGAAFSGLGMVMEFVAQRVKEIAASKTSIPVELTAQLVGPMECGREMISVDTSEYGDPLQTRAFRAPFSPYLKPLQQRELLGPEIVSTLPLLYQIPVQDIDFIEGIKIMRDKKRLAELAGKLTTWIPDESETMGNLISSYRRSTLADFHTLFYSQEHEPPEAWPQTYDCLPMSALPRCARYVLEHPNDFLLRPSGIKRIVRVMLALGWHPRHIAGLIRSKYERSHYNWGSQWVGYDPATRADFYTRVFAGLFVTKRDDLVDFNAKSACEEGLLPPGLCNGVLDDFRKSAIERRNYERLAHWPFNRLFLPEKDL